MKWFSNQSCLRLVAVLIAAGVGPLSGDPIIGAPVGYTVSPVPGNSEVLVPVQIAKPISFRNGVTEVTPSGVRFSEEIPSRAFDVTVGGILEVFSGAMAGIGIPATGFSGNFVTLERSPVGLVAPGDVATLREQHTLGSLFPLLQYFPLQTGTSAEEADNISTWDAKTQTSRVFYLHTGVGFREAGKFSDGDQSNAPIPFPSGMIVRRQAQTQVDVVISGEVMWPGEKRYHPVWPGRNIVSAPFTTVKTVASYIRPLLDAPHTVLGAASAAEADTLRFYGPDGTISPLIYFQNNRWRTVGIDEDASETAVLFNPCLDLQRAGPAGFVRFEGFVDVFLGAPTSSLRMAETIVEVKPVTLRVSAEGVTATWPAKPGLTYQVQTRPPGESNWSNLNHPVPATDATASMSFAPSESGCVRVIEL